MLFCTNNPLLHFGQLAPLFLPLFKPAHFLEKRPQRAGDAAGVYRHAQTTGWILDPGTEKRPAFVNMLHFIFRDNSHYLSVRAKPFLLGVHHEAQLSG